MNCLTLPLTISIMNANLFMILTQHARWKWSIKASPKFGEQAFQILEHIFHSLAGLDLIRIIILLVFSKMMPQKRFRTMIQDFTILLKRRKFGNNFWSVLDNQNQYSLIVNQRSMFQIQHNIWQKLSKDIKFLMYSTSSLTRRKKINFHLWLLPSITLSYQIPISTPSLTHIHLEVYSGNQNNHNALLSNCF